MTTKVRTNVSQAGMKMKLMSMKKGNLALVASVNFRGDPNSLFEIGRKV